MFIYSVKRSSMFLLLKPELRKSHNSGDRKKHIVCIWFGRCKGNWSLFFPLLSLPRFFYTRSLELAFCNKSYESFSLFFSLKASVMSFWILFTLLRKGSQKRPKSKQQLTLFLFLPIHSKHIINSWRPGCCFQHRGIFQESLCALDSHVSINASTNQTTSVAHLNILCIRRGSLLNSEFEL